MKKQTKIILGSVAIILLVVACVFGFKIGFDKKNKNSTPTVFECLPSDILSYSVDNGKGEVYKLVREKDGWKAENNEAAIIDSGKAEELIRCASKITATGIADKVSLNGADKTVQTVEIGLPDGENVEIKFFGENVDVCFFMVSGDDTVYTLYTSVKDILTEPFDTLRILEVFEDFDDEKNMPETYEFTDYDKSKISLRLKTGYESAKDDKNRYMMTEPYLRSVDDEKFVQQVVVKLSAITRAGKFVDDNPESPEKYGLDKESRASLTLGRDGMTSTLYLGKNENGVVYAQMKGQSGVFSIKSTQLEFLSIEPFYLIDSRLLERSFEKINKISITVGSEKINLNRNSLGDGSEWFSLNGKNSSKDFFEEITGLINGLEVVSELITVPENTKDISMKIQADGEQFDMTLVPSGEKEYAIFIGGKARFAVDRQKVDEIIERMKK